MDWLKRVRCWIVGHRWYATLQAGHEYSFCARCSMPERDPAAQERDALLQRVEQAEAERDELRKVVDSECPIAAMDIVSTLRVQKQDFMEYIAKLEAALPDPEKLERIAEWFDKVDGVMAVRYGLPTRPEMQTDIRAWAERIRDLMPQREAAREGASDGE